MNTHLKPQSLTRSLRVLFTDKERLELGKQLAEESQKLEQIADDKKTVVADFKSRQTAAEAKIASLSQQVANGYQVKEVKCEMRFDTPEAGKKTLVRLDTSETVEVADMLDIEKQQQLPLADADGGTTTKTVLDSDEGGVVKVPADEDDDKE